MLYGYMKVSTQDQTDNLQRDVLQSAGMAAAKVRGTHCGRPRAANAEAARIIREWHSAGGCVKEIARKLKVSHRLVYKSVKEFSGLGAQITIPEVAGMVQV